MPRTVSSMLAHTTLSVLIGGMSAALAQTTENVIRLPAPRSDGPMSVERALQARRSVRSFTRESVSLQVISQLAWAAQGITRRAEAPAGWQWGTWQGGRRTAPSAGALYPLELYAVCGAVNDLSPGIYKYKPQTHQLALVRAGDHRLKLSAAAMGQQWMGAAPCIFVVGAVFARTEVKYGQRAARYVHIEAGHAVENICLQAVALELGSTMVGAFRDSEVKEVLGMAKDEEPLAIVPVGKPTG